MLVLTRRNRQRIRLVLNSGEVVWITLLEARGSEASIGIEASHRCEILREELIGAPKNAGAAV